MAEKVQLEIEVKGGDSVGKASQKVESLRTQLKNMKAELASGNLSGIEFEKMAQKAGALQDQIGDVNQRVKNLASDSKMLDGFVSVATGITGGFAAAQGAMALFGDENEDLQKTLVKVQGAVALLNGFQAVANTLNKDSAASTALLGNANLFNTIKTNAAAAATTLYTFATNGATLATKAFRIALIATGIGAIVILIGSLVAAMSEAGDATDEATEKIKKQNDALKEHQELLANESDEYVKNRNVKKGNLNDLKRELDLMKSRGDSAKDIYNQEKKIRDQERKDLNYQLAFNVGNAKLEQELTEKLRDNENAAIVAKYTFEKQQRELAIKAREQAKAEQLKKDEKFNKMVADQAAAAEKDKRIALAEKLDEELDEKEKSNGRIIKVDTKLSEEQLFLIQRQRDLEKQALEQRQQLLSDGLGALSDITTAFASKSEQGQRRAFAVNKALNISTTLIDTYMASQKAYSSQLTIPTPDAPIRAQVAAGISIASGLARVAAISATQFGGSASGRSTGGGGSQSGSPQNNSPQLQGFSTSNQRAVQGGDAGAMKVFVTETDIRSTGKKVGGIYAQATVE